MDEQHDGSAGAEDVSAEETRAEIEVLRARLRDQVSGLEVPGFHARTVIDDAIGKLYAIRSRILVPVPDELPAMLDQIEALVELAFEVAYDPDGAEVESFSSVTDPDLGRLRVSGSDCVTHCSCGGLFAPDAPKKKT